MTPESTPQESDDDVRRETNRAKARARMARHRALLKDKTVEEQAEARAKAQEAQATYRRRHRMRLRIAQSMRRKSMYIAEHGEAAWDEKHAKKLARRSAEIEKQRRARKQGRGSTKRAAKAREKTLKRARGAQNDSVEVKAVVNEKQGMEGGGTESFYLVARQRRRGTEESSARSTILVEQTGSCIFAEETGSFAHRRGGEWSPAHSGGGRARGRDGPWNCGAVSQPLLSFQLVLLLLALAATLLACNTIGVRLVIDMKEEGVIFSVSGNIADDDSALDDHGA
ncbi:hypothetical protein C8R47DRAFT_1069572 [Mycena vitilis]|nr:hypothetical protein C8R47DRAFT_1069572 [Mycena vitilis]